MNNEIEGGAESMHPKSIAYDLLGLKSVWTVNQVVEMVAGPKPIVEDQRIKYQWTRLREIIRQALMDAIKTRELVPLNDEWIQDHLIDLRSSAFGNGFEYEVYRSTELRRDDLIRWMKEKHVLEDLKQEGFQIPTKTIELIELNEAIPEEADIASSSSEIEQAKINQKELVFRRRCDIWEVGFDNIISIKHSMGMTYIQHLLIRPNKDISCFDLELSENRRESSSSEKGFFNNDNDENFSDENLCINKSKDDQDTDLNIKRKLSEAKNAVEQAEREGSLDVDMLQKEYQEVLKYYETLYDINGNLREGKIEEEKARKRVCRAIETARKKIGQHLPDLKDILKHLKLGHFPVFNPPIDNPKLEIIAD